MGTGIGGRRSDRKPWFEGGCKRCAPRVVLITAIAVLAAINLAAQEPSGLVAHHDQLRRLIQPRFTLPEILGFVAGFGTTFAAVPDMIAMLKRRSSAGVNPRMAAIMISFQILWAYYGVLVGSRPVVVWNVIAVGINASTVWAYLHFVRREKANG
jgi:uncharacterized protein with PQ loop repeat